MLHNRRRVACNGSAGHDRAFRLFSVIQDQQSRELSQRHTAKRAKKLHVREEDLKLPCVIDMAACQVPPGIAAVAASHSGVQAAAVRPPICGLLLVALCWLTLAGARAGLVQCHYGSPRLASCIHLAPEELHARCRPMPASPAHVSRIPESGSCSPLKAALEALLLCCRGACAAATKGTGQQGS